MRIGRQLAGHIMAQGTVGPPVRLPVVEDAAPPGGPPPVAVAPAPGGGGEDLAGRLSAQLALCGIAHEREYVFAPPRKWRIDLAWPRELVACECEGGIYGRGRHIRPEGFLGDVEKYNELALRGWLLVRVTGGMIEDGRALGLVERALAARRG